MSNIVAHVTHTTPALKNDTNFVNVFLDNLLEVYCSKRFVENTCYPNLKFPTLTDLIAEAYPAYYIKSNGLLGHITSTNVLKIYNEDLHYILIHALEHKLSVLFINVSNTVAELNLTINHGSSLQKNKNLSLMSVDRLYSILNSRAYHKLKPHHFHELIKSTNQIVTMDPLKPQLVYKPNLEAIRQLSESIKIKNEEVFNRLDFFDIRSAYKSDLIMRIAFTIETYNQIDYFSANLTPEFYARVKEMSSIIVNHAYKKIDVIKSDIQQHEHQLELRRQRDAEIEQWKKEQEFERMREHRKRMYESHIIETSKPVKKKKESDEIEVKYKELISPVDKDRNKSILGIDQKDLIASGIVGCIMILPPLCMYIFR